MTEELTREQRRSRRRREVRGASLPERDSATEVRRLALLVPRLSPEEQASRPRTRGDCADGPRPCPWVSCRWNLFLDVRRTGTLTLNFPDLEPEELEHSCTLDAADQGGMRLEDVAARLNITRERVRQIESAAMDRLGERHRLVLLEHLGVELGEETL